MTPAVLCYQVSRGNITAGVVFHHDRLVRSAPILRRWLAGRTTRQAVLQALLACGFAIRRAVLKKEETGV